MRVFYKVAVLFSWMFGLSLLFVLPAQAQFILSPEALSVQLKQVVVLDARSEQSYETGHIEGALSFPVDWTFANKSLDGAIVQPAQAQAILRQLGITSDTKVVVYDSGSMMDAARLFWTLEVYGIKQVQVLDMGYAGWTVLGYAQSLDLPSRTPSDYVARIDHHRIATKLTTLAATQNPQQIIIDARGASDYVGKTSTAHRYGHIPEARNIPATQNVINTEDRGAQFLSLAALNRVYADVPKDKRVILYCAIGRVSSSNYLALRSLGYDVANYDASWQQWGNDFNLPIQNPSNSILGN
jgi:thiosulfate/3-mercaptopyruvate sulfurtransferase